MVSLCEWTRLENCNYGFLGCDWLEDDTPSKEEDWWDSCRGRVITFSVRVSKYAVGHKYTPQNVCYTFTSLMHMLQQCVGATLA